MRFYDTTGAEVKYNKAPYMSNNSDVGTVDLVNKTCPSAWTKAGDGSACEKNEYIWNA